MGFPTLLGYTDTVSKDENRGPLTKTGTPVIASSRLLVQGPLLPPMFVLSIFFNYSNSFPWADGV